MSSPGTHEKLIYIGIPVFLACNQILFVFSVYQILWMNMEVLVIPRKRWFRPDMTARLLTGAFNHNTNKQINRVRLQSRAVA